MLSLIRLQLGYGVTPLVLAQTPACTQTTFLGKTLNTKKGFNQKKTFETLQCLDEWLVLFSRKPHHQSVLSSQLQPHYLFIDWNTYSKHIGWQLPKHIDITRQRQQKNYLSVAKLNLNSVTWQHFYSTAWTQSFDSLEMGHFILYLYFSSNSKVWHCCTTDRSFYCLQW